MNSRIGIVGSGMIGGQVARLAVKAGMAVEICNTRGPASLKLLVDELGSTAHATTLPDMVKCVDMIVLAVPLVAYSKLSVESLADKIVIDTLNYYPERDGVLPEIRTDKISTSELVQAHLVRSRVVRALNNLDFVRLGNLARPAGSTDRSALPVAGDDAAAKGAVIEFLDRIGYDVVDMGPLSESWRSEPTMPIYVTPYSAAHATSLVSGEKYSFMSDPGRTVTKAKAAELIGQAVRHAKMFGSLGNFDLSSFR